MLDVFFRSMEDLDERRRRVLQPRDPRPLEAHLRHLQASDPRTCIVADDHGSLAAFGVAMVREGQAFLSFLFVVPAWQGRGIGRAVTLACLQAAGETLRVATCAEADQLVSTGQYASLGVQAHLLDASGPPDSAVGALDLEVLGYRRPLDHAFWASGGRRGWSFEASGTLLGYGYAHPSGRIGPVAARQPDLLPAMLGHLVRGTPVLEGRQAIVPGAAAAALRLLMAAGLRMDGTPAVYCTDRPGPRLDRYLPMSFALL